MTLPADPILSRTDHRPWPLPTSPWVIAQDWNDVLFLHWRVDAAKLRNVVPTGLEIETFDGSAWLGVTPLLLTGVRARFTPPLPVVSHFPELNVRTYVRRGDRPGIWFFSLDCANPMAVAAARAAYALPYFLARIDVQRTAAGVDFRARRTHPDSPEVAFHAKYRSAGDPAEATRGSFERWACERYCLYAQPSNGALTRTEIHHAPWMLESASADVEVNEVAAAAGVAVEGSPEHVHYAARQEVVTWLPVAADSRETGVEVTEETVIGSA
jgi:uncharacterized protein YqjF (DUF2071 family)